MFPLRTVNLPVSGALQHYLNYRKMPGASGLRGGGARRIPAWRGVAPGVGGPLLPSVATGKGRRVVDLSAAVLRGREEPCVSRSLAHSCAASGRPPNLSERYLSTYNGRQLTFALPMLSNILKRVRQEAKLD